MDLALIKTFLTVAETRSFAAASDQLFVTQSAVSLRIHRLEDQLGHPLFIRSKLGVEFTPAGQEFLAYAETLVRTWELARQQVAIPSGFKRSLNIGAPVSLWPRLGFRWLDGLRAALPDVGIRAEVGLSETLTRSMTDGAMQVALTFNPVQRPGFLVEKLIEDEFVLVASWENPTLDQLKGRYAYVDWGPAFQQFHSIALPELTNPGLTLAVGSLAAGYVQDRDCAVFIPARLAKRGIESGKLHLVEDAPQYTHSSWSVWRDDLDEDLALVARQTLLSVRDRADIDTEAVVDMIEMSEQ